MPDQFIRLYQIDSRGDLVDVGEDYSLDDLCGAIPRVGDFIVSREVNNIGEQGVAHWWENRLVQVVDAVYFRPDKRFKPEHDSWVSVVVRERQMTENEQNLL